MLFSVIQVAAACYQQLVLICIYMGQPIGPCVFCVCLSVCMLSNQSTSKNHVICVQPSAK